MDIRTILKTLFVIQCDNEPTIDSKRLETPLNTNLATPSSPSSPSRPSGTSGPSGPSKPSDVKDMRSTQLSSEDQLDEYLGKDIRVDGVSEVSAILRKLSDISDINTKYINTIVLFMPLSDVTRFKRILLMNPDLYFTNWIHKESPQFESIYYTRYRRKLICIIDDDTYQKSVKPIVKREHSDSVQLIVVGNLESRSGV